MNAFKLFLLSLAWAPSHSAITLDSSNNIIKNATSGETLTSTMETGDLAFVSTEMAPISPNFTTARFGTVSVLMIRVTTEFEGESKEPDFNKQELSEALFASETTTRQRKSPSSLAKQMETCSFGQLKMVPFEGNMPSGVEVTDGVVELTLDNYDFNNRRGKNKGEVREAAREAFGEDYKLSAHFILYCMPNGLGRANAVRNQVESFYFGKGCGNLGSLMHEVGHSLGNGHSGSDIDGPGEREDYGDYSGEMGRGNNCYNPPKNFAMGWYANQTETIDPLDGTGTHNVLLNGFADFAKNDEARVSVRLETPFSQECEEDENCEQYDYFIGFNYATGINEYSRIQGDEVWVGYAKKNDPQGDSFYVALLSLGESYEIEDFDGNDNVVTVLFSSLANGGDATVQIIDGVGPSQPPPQPFNCVDSDDTFPFGDNDSYSCAQLPTYEPALESRCIGKSSSSEDAARLRAHCPSSCCRQCEGGVKIICEKPPTASPTEFPTDSPTAITTGSPSKSPTASPTVSPTVSPTGSPTKSPSYSPSTSPSSDPSAAPSAFPSASPSKSPSASPSFSPSGSPSGSPSFSPSGSPSDSPSESPSAPPSASPSGSPSGSPSAPPSASPSGSPSSSPSGSPSSSPSGSPSASPSASPTASPTVTPTSSPTKSPTASPTESPTGAPTASPTVSPTHFPTLSPTLFSDFCFDVPSSEWTYRGKENQGCEWIAEKPLKRQKPFCKKRANEDTEDKRRVSVYCGATCFRAGDKNACK